VLTPLKPLFLLAALQPAAGPADPAAIGPALVGPVGMILAEHEVEVSLAGSPESVARQHAVAVASELSFVGTLEEMELLAREGELEPIPGGRHYEVMDWVFPYGIPEVRTFVERLAIQYREACGEALVVTSLTRPYSEQPPNSHQLSVHPAGMAVDLRIPQNPRCREFLEARLLEKEAAGILDITHERAPPHYHVAVFPEPYARFVAMQPAIEELEPDPVPVTHPARPMLWGLVILVLLAVAGAGAALWYLRVARDAKGSGER
jgi:hypothetical protein